MGSPTHHIPSSTSPIAGQKRPAPSLLPPFTFEPSQSSSPVLPRPKKRRMNASPDKHGLEKEKQVLPTPDPTSSTLVPSSPAPLQTSKTRRPLQRTVSALSERAPLTAVPSIELSEHGEPTLMGRSSNSSHYQLSTNKLISRIHVRAAYIASASPTEASKVLIECTGWNGCKVHCQGQTWDLMKGDTFTSETEDADIMIDVQDARILLQWPKIGEGKVLTPTDSDRSSWEGELSPRRRAAVAAGQARRAGHGPPYTSPLRQQARLHSPVSPSPALQSAPIAAPSGFLDSNPPQSIPVKVYEDEPSEGDRADNDDGVALTQQTQISTQVATQNKYLLEGSQGTNDSSLSDPPHDFSDNDEENDPIISSFGPFGANLSARMENVNAVSPLDRPQKSPESHRRPLQPLKEASISPQRPASLLKHRLEHSEDSTIESQSTGHITNHIINQLAYSALSATPLGTLYEGIPSHLKRPKFLNGELLTMPMLESLLDATACIGAVERSGKDAAGKRLDSEFYYVPEMDNDEKRREVVTGLGGRGLRNCRKSHKVRNRVSPHQIMSIRATGANRRCYSNIFGGNRNRFSTAMSSHSKVPD